MTIDQRSKSQESRIKKPEPSPWIAIHGLPMKLKHAFRHKNLKEKNTALVSP